MLAAMVSVSARPRECSIARTLEIVGEKWALLAVREVFLGNGRFDEMVRRTGAPRDTMAARLRALVGTGILERRQYSEHPARFEYHLTEAGRDLYPVILTLMRWGDKHLAGPDGAAAGARAPLRPPAERRGGVPGLRRAGRRRADPAGQKPMTVPPSLTNPPSCDRDATWLFFMISSVPLPGCQS